MGYTLTQADKQYVRPAEKVRALRWSEPKASEKPVIKRRIEIIDEDIVLMQSRLKEQETQSYNARKYIAARAQVLIPELKKAIEYLQERKQYYVDLYNR